MRTAVVIPARNEEAGIARVLEELPREFVDRIVVVDNGSTDGTVRVARAHGVILVSESRPGYGRACLRGIDALRGDPPDSLLFLDADASDTPDEVPALLAPLRTGEAELVIGSRTRGGREPGAHPVHARFGNRFATFLIRWRTGYRFTDLGPFRAVRWQTLMDFGMRDPDFGWTAEMQIRAALAGVHVSEVPVSSRRRIGRSKISGTFGGSLLAGIKIILTVLEPGPAAV